VAKIPQSRSTTDFVVICFVVTICAMLLGFALATIIGGLGGGDVKPYVATLTDIMTTIVGALIGYIAGKGQGQAEAHEQQQKREDDLHET
jgi:hypothetical protein